VETKEEEGKKKNRKERSVCLLFAFCRLAESHLKCLDGCPEDAKGKMKCLECKEEKKAAIISLTRPNMCWRVVIWFISVVFVCWQ